MVKDVNCPYCDHEFDVNEDDGAHCEQDGYGEEQCPECEKTMMVSTSWYASRSAFKADCLNDKSGEHDWHSYEDIEWVNPQPIKHNARRCHACRKIERNTQ